MMLPLSTVAQSVDQLGRIEAWRVVRHPLLILLIGAALSSILVPWQTRRWQDRRRKEEVKTALVAEVADCVMSLLVRIEGVRAIRNTAESTGANNAQVAGYAESEERPTSASLSWRLRRRLRGMLGQREAVASAAARCGGVDQEWCELEELFLAEKLRIILRIRSEDLRI